VAKLKIHTCPAGRPALSCPAGQGEENFDESFSDQDRAGQDRATGQDRAEKSALWPSLI